MLPVFIANGEAHDARLRRASWGEAPCFCSSWNEFQRRAADAPCLVVVDPWLTHSSTPERLAELSGLTDAHPLVVVTARHPDNARALIALPIAELVWLEELGNGQPALAIRRATADGALEQVRRRIAQCRRLKPQLRTALTAALDGSRQLRTVEDLADIAGRDRRTIWRWWRAACPDHPCATPRQLLDWLLTLRALAAHVPGRSWAQVALDLGIHDDTLARLVRRTLGRRLSEVGPSELQQVMQEIEHLFDQLVDPITSTAPEGADAPTSTP